MQQGSARPTEILTALGIVAGEHDRGIRRTEVEWDIELTGPTQWPAAPERNQFGQEENNGNRPSGQEDTQEQTS
jgi:hypothetical protein